MAYTNNIETTNIDSNLEFDPLRKDVEVSFGSFPRYPDAESEDYIFFKTS